MIVDVGGDESYQTTHVTRRQPDGTWKDAWIVTTRHEGGLSYSVGEGVKVQTGGPKRGGWGEDVKAGGSINGSLGTSYEYDNVADAKKAVDHWKGSHKPWPWHTQGIKDPVVTESIEASGTISAEGTVGVANGSIGATAVDSISRNNVTGEQKVSVHMSDKVAVEIGIPLPKVFAELSASGEASKDSGIELTFDKDNNLVSVQVSKTATIKGEAGAGVQGVDKVPGLSGVLESAGLPTSKDVAAGRQFRLTATTDFRNADGSVDHAAIAAAGLALTNVIFHGRPPSDQQKAVMRDQLNNHSRITADVYDYANGEDAYGLEGKAVWVGIGVEGHVATEDTHYIAGRYLDPETGEWLDRVGCAS